VTKDQDHFRPRETTAYFLEVSPGMDSSRQTNQDVIRTLCLRRGAGTVPDEAASIGGWGRRIGAGPAMPISSHQLRGKSASYESATARLFTSAHEDIARLAEILRHQQCSAAVRGVDGAVFTIDASAAPVGGQVGVQGRFASGLLKSRSASQSLSATIYDSEGRAFASLELSTGDMDRSDSSYKLLHALIESAARSMTERWFRLVHRRQWIVAARRRTSPHTSMLLAVDRDQRVVAADKDARQILEQKGRRYEKRLPLTAFFQSAPSLLRRRGHCDASITLQGSSDAEPWIALVTAPDFVAAAPDHDARAMLHVRPRWDCLTRLLSMGSDGDERPGLSRCALRRVEEYVDAHLDAALDIDELAALVRMSPSHFTRSFNRSVGLTPHRYVIQCRVGKARELLTTTDLPLTEIALNIGFSDQSHFSRRFQEFVGMPPGAFRRAGATDGRP
jgi:AraC-like DNA-binding protein